ncbi:hypothetical protein TNCV_2258801 [Trichonephila clavipes]|nr:hypothetical protein TNCV_2258801 [Trichonephila clavipes]
MKVTPGFSLRPVAASENKMKSFEKWCASAFKADRTTSKRIRYEFITVKSTTLIELNSPRKNTALPAIACALNLDAPTFFTNPCFL